MTRLTEQQLAVIREDVALAATLRRSGVAAGAVAVEAWSRVGDQHGRALLGHIDHLTADLAAVDEHLKNCGGSELPTPLRLAPQ